MPFWQRPYVERYLTPLVLPVVVVGVIVVYVLNVSRVFLSVHGHIPVIAGTVITLLILIGATLLANAPRMRPTSIVLVTVGFLLVVSLSGWISLGASQNKEGGVESLPATLKTDQTFKVTAAPGGQFAYVPDSIDAKTGLAKFSVTAAVAGHDFGFHEPQTLFAQLTSISPGAPVDGVAFFPAPGDYHYFCAVPGHEAAGMKGVVHVTGDPITLDEALTKAGNPPGAAGG